MPEYTEYKRPLSGDAFLDRKNNRIILDKPIARMFRQYNVKSVILAPEKTCHEELVKKDNVYVPLKKEFNLIRLYPDIFKLLIYGSIEQKNEAREASLKYYSRIKIPDDFGKHLQHFGEELTLVYIPDVAESWEIWDKDVLDYYTKTGKSAFELARSIKGITAQEPISRKELKQLIADLF